MKTIAVAVLTTLALSPLLWAAGDAVVAQQPTANPQSRIQNPKSADAITIPQMLSYQGKLTDTFGLPVTDTVYAIRFRLYAQLSGGTHFWEENQQVRTRGGVFSTLLGSATPIGSMPDAGEAYLGMAVEGGAELSPRLRIASAAYAYLTERAADADLLQGKDTTALDARYVNEAQANSVTSAMLVDGTIAAADLGQMGASSGQVMKWTGSAWAPRNDSVGAGGTGTVTSVAQATGVVCTPNPITTTGTVGFDQTYGDGRYVNEGQTAGGDLTGTYPSPTITTNAVGSAEVIDNSLRGADIAKPCTLSASLPSGAVLSVTNTGGGDALLATGTARFTGQIVSTVTDQGFTSRAGRATDNDGRRTMNDDAGARGRGQDLAPLVVNSTTLCANLNADLLDGYSAASTGTNIIPHTDTSGKLNIAVVPGVSYADSARVAANSYRLQGRDTTGFVRTAQTNSVTSAMIVNGTIAAVDLNQMGASTGQVMKWTGSAWAPRNDSVGGGGDNAWVRSGSDSVLYTIRQLGLARGGAGNVLRGDQKWTHVNFGVACTTGRDSGTDMGEYCACNAGYGNRATGDFSTVSGGEGNRASGEWATVGGGFSNRAEGEYSTVGGGWNDYARSGFCAVGGGRDNYALGECATVGGGSANRVEASWGGVFSGTLNRVGDELADSAAVVGGGWFNNALAKYSTVAGGRFNSAIGPWSFVGGGSVNGAAGDLSTVGGGWHNVVMSGCDWGTVAGGYENKVSGPAAFVGGGSLNEASGYYSVVPGGAENKARGANSLASGRYARANHDGSFVWSDFAVAASESVYTNDSNQFRVRARGGTWFYSNAAKTTGAYLAPGSNAWQSACDSATKEDFRPVDRKALLEKVASLRLRNYKLKDQNDGTRHIGPVAQDFHAAFGVGETSTGINMADMDGVALAAIQALCEDNRQLRQEVETLRAELKARK